MNAPPPARVTRRWTTRFDTARYDELLAFATEHSAPMFDSLEGCVGFEYSVSGDLWVTQTWWTSREAIAAAEASALYRMTVAGILAPGYLREPQTTEVFDLVRGRG